MSDEIYEKLVYDGAQHASVASFSQSITNTPSSFTGLAKAYSMTGWRIGMTAAPEPIAKAIDAIQSHSTSNPTSFAQKGAVAALNGPRPYRRLAGGIVPAAAPTPGKNSTAFLEISCVNARAHFNLFPNISKTGLGSIGSSAPKLLKRKSRRCPGHRFGADDYQFASVTPPAWRTSKRASTAWRFCKRNLQLCRHPKQPLFKK